MDSLGVIKKYNAEILFGNEDYFAKINEEVKKLIIVIPNMPSNDELVAYIEDLIEKKIVTFNLAHDVYVISVSGSNMSDGQVMKKCGTPEEADPYKCLEKMISQNDGVFSFKTGGTEFDYINGKQVIKKTAIVEITGKTKEMHLKELETKKEMEISRMTTDAQIRMEQTRMNLELEVGKLKGNTEVAIKEIDSRMLTSKIEHETRIAMIRENNIVEIEKYKESCAMERDKMRYQTETTIATLNASTKEKKIQSKNEIARLVETNREERIIGYIGYIEDLTICR